LLAIDPKHFGALNNMAWVHLQTKDPRALEYAERALAESPDRPEALDTLAQIQASQKEFGKAIDSLKRAINRATNSAPLRLSLAKIYIQANDRLNAINELEKLVALGKSSPYYLPARKLLAEQRKA
jgi:cellulose synthase operon protein C